HARAFEQRLRSEQRRQQLQQPRRADQAGHPQLPALAVARFLLIDPRRDSARFFLLGELGLTWVLELKEQPGLRQIEASPSVSADSLTGIKHPWSPSSNHRRSGGRKVIPMKIRSATAAFCGVAAFLLL